MRFMILIAGLIALATEARALDYSQHPNDSKGLLAVMAKGVISEGDADRFRNYLASVPARKRTVVYLDSPGGNLHEGMRLGQAFHRLGVRSVIEGNGSSCLSACALAFLGGRDQETGKAWRTKSSSSRLGFHSWASRIPQNKSYTAADMMELEQDTQRTVLDVADYLLAIGTDLDFLRLMFRASASEMNFISDDEALRIGIRVWDERSNRFLVP